MEVHRNSELGSLWCRNLDIINKLCSRGFGAMEGVSSSLMSLDLLHPLHYFTNQVQSHDICSIHPLPTRSLRRVPFFHILPKFPASDSRDVTFDVRVGFANNAHAYSLHIGGSDVVSHCVQNRGLLQSDTGPFCQAI